VVENNVVVTDHWHGISFYGMRDSRIVNNTVIDLADGQPGPPWIMVHAHKDGRPSQDVLVRNNLATDFSIEGNAIVDDHNLLIGDAATLFVAPPFDLHLRAGASAIDAGSAESAPPLDADRVPRPQGAGFDLGAYEYRGDAIFSDGFDASTVLSQAGVTVALAAPVHQEKRVLVGAAQPRPFCRKRGLRSRLQRSCTRKSEFS
jgi:hypothetical protein